MTKGDEMSLHATHRHGTRDKDSTDEQIATAVRCEQKKESSLFRHSFDLQSKLKKMSPTAEKSKWHRNGIRRLCTSPLRRPTQPPIHTQRYRFHAWAKQLRWSAENPFSLISLLLFEDCDKKKGRKIKMACLFSFLLTNFIVVARGSASG